MEANRAEEKDSKVGLNSVDYDRTAGEIESHLSRCAPWVDWSVDRLGDIYGVEPKSPLAYTIYGKIWVNDKLLLCSTRVGRVLMDGGTREQVLSEVAADLSNMLEAELRKATENEDIPESDESWHYSE